MNRKQSLLLIPAVSLSLLTACGHNRKKEDAQAAQQPPTVAQQITTDLASQRDQYVQQTEARVSTIEKQVENLRYRSGQVENPDRKKLQNAAEDLESLLRDVQKELQDVRSAAVENWVDEKRDVEKAMNRAESQYSNSLSLIR